MSVNINYLSVRAQSNVMVGEIEFFDTYRKASVDFPYFYLDQKNVTIFDQNWPDLVPYLYEETTEIIDNNKNVTKQFTIYSLSNNANLATMTFTDSSSIKMINALLEDRRTYFIENNKSDVGWNKTFTPKTDIAISGTTFFSANNNYYIRDIIINNENSVSITANTEISNNFNTTVLTNKEIEFGIYRIPGTVNNVYWSGMKSIYLCNNNENFFKGLKIRSQIIGHAHDHSHSLNNHTHIMSHTHNISHTHNMSHNHTYSDRSHSMSSLLNGADYQYNPLVLSNELLNGYTTTVTSSIANTEQPNINISGDASNITSNSISNNVTSNILNQIMGNNSNVKINEFIKNNKNIPESYTVFAYFYGKQYIE